MNSNDVSYIVTPLQTHVIVKIVSNDDTGGYSLC